MNPSNSNRHFHFPYKRYNWGIYLFATLGIFIFALQSCKKIKNTDGNASSSTIKFLNGGIQDKVTAVIKTTDHGFLYLGYTTNFINTDAFMLKVDSNGNQEWYKSYGGKDFDYFMNATCTSDGGFV